MGDKFQLNFDTIRLYPENNTPPPVTKVGIVPFIPHSQPESWRSMVMKPSAKAKHLGDPGFQIAKGTRRIHINDRWCDMRDEDLRHADDSFFEPLIETALREGQEEVGLKASNVRRLFDMGGFTFTSATKSIQRPLHMFAAEIADSDDFMAFEASTAETRWVTLQEFRALGREDHIKILEAILTRLHRAV